ncbi:hypothetical protein ABD1_08730 [Acinetobacter baumannii D1279779]|nr:hypothetical protein ABD1_08730 [Acinetobacter baumannii D1279779]
MKLEERLKLLAPFSIKPFLSFVFFSSLISTAIKNQRANE